MKLLSRIRYMTYLACIVIEFTGDAVSEEVLLEMNTFASGLLKINTTDTDWVRFFECMRNRLTSRCTLNLNETGTSGNYREFQSNGIRYETIITKWLETSTFECNFQEKCKDTTEKCYSIVCSRPQNNCTLMSGCNGVLKIQWKSTSVFYHISGVNSSWPCSQITRTRFYSHDATVDSPIPRKTSYSPSTQISRGPPPSNVTNHQTMV
ncbi:hypothetical protein Bpfe_026707 [Biomphalaria pfeifferi]|uniref:Uncharacterized protein n=1 Tax=Biomphalaria pfeifferi TaxID=112525 RepID=A0AAD8AWQ2_BIOPF|nr:hypothetical protein Bpfe_026707 [Biomphalaria pfeifferi]